MKILTQIIEFGTVPALLWVLLRHMDKNCLPRKIIEWLIVVFAIGFVVWFYKTYVFM